MMVAHRDVPTTRWDTAAVPRTPQPAVLKNPRGCAGQVRTDGRTRVRRTATLAMAEGH